MQKHCDFERLCCFFGGACLFDFIFLEFITCCIIENRSYYNNNTIVLHNYLIILTTMSLPQQSGPSDMIYAHISFCNCS